MDFRRLKSQVAVSCAMQWIEVHRGIREGMCGLARESGDRREIVSATSRPHLTEAPKEAPEDDLKVRVLRLEDEKRDLLSQSAPADLQLIPSGLVQQNRHKVQCALL